MPETKQIGLREAARIAKRKMELTSPDTVLNELEANQKVRGTLPTGAPNCPPVGKSDVKITVADKPKKAVVTYQCGHNVGVAQLENQPCGMCREKARQAKRLKKQTNKVPQDAKRNISGRLPDLSGFEFLYHADKERWFGKLTIPNVGVFEDDTSAILDLPKKLDAKYRESMK